MPKIRFTKTTIDRLAFSGKRVDYFDTESGLGLRVGASTKTFFIKADVKDANTKSGYRTVRRTLGRYGELTLEQAKKMLTGYDDPNKGFVPGARLELKRESAEALGSKVTLRNMLQQYLTETRTRQGHKRKGSTSRDYEARIHQHFASWLDLTLPDIATLPPQVLIDHHRQIDQDHGPYAARNAFVVLVAVLNYAVVKYPAAIPRNPAGFMTPKNAGILAPIKAREDCLSGEDFRQFYDGVQEFNDVTRDCYLLALFQGLRSTEASALRWEHVHLDKEELRVPDTKNRHTLHVPLCHQSLKILQRRQKQAPEGASWVFASEFRLNKTGHIRLTAATLRAKTGLNLTVHGLRRTFITEGLRLKLDKDTDRLTNHRDGSVTSRFYDATEISDLRQSLQRIADSLERQMTGKPAQVVTLVRQHA